MPQPLISIIVPTFNAAALIGECLESLGRQTLTDLEVLVLDGGSRDETVSVAHHRARGDARIRVFSEPDRGIYDAMNKGVKRSRGRWLLFLGSDDRLGSGDVLERISPLLRDDVDIVYGDVFHERRQCRVGGAFSVERLMVETICHQAMIFRADFLRRMGEFDLNFRIAADWDMNLRCFAAGARARYVDLVVAHYSGQGVSSRSVDQEFDACRLERIARYWDVPVWHRRLQTCRFAFRERALDEYAAGNWSAAMRQYSLYAWHSARAKLLGSRGKRT